MTSIDIPVFRPSMAGMQEAVAEALDGGWLGMGPLTARFERDLAACLGVADEHVVCTGTGTAALHTALVAAGVRPGDDVVVPAINFAADAQAVLACGASVVLCDVCDDDLNLDLTACKRLLGPRTRAILPLHYAGRPMDHAALSDFGAAHDLRIVEDATHALGSRHGDGIPVGGRGDLICFSFDPVKIITSLDGGAVVASSARDADLARRFRDLGITRDSHSRHAAGTPWSYDVVGQGFRYHLNSVNAAVGISQLRQLDYFAAERQHICHHYVRRLGQLQPVRLVGEDFTGIAPFIFSIRVPAAVRDAVRAALGAAGVATGLHFRCLHELSAFSNARCGPLPVAEAAAAELITLPLFVGMTGEEVDRVCDVITACLAG